MNNTNSTLFFTSTTIFRQIFTALIFLTNFNGCSTHIFQLFSSTKSVKLIFSSNFHGLIFFPMPKRSRQKFQNNLLVSFSSCFSYHTTKTNEIKLIIFPSRQSKFLHNSRTTFFLIHICSN